MSFIPVHVCVDCKGEFLDPAPAMMPPDLAPNLDGTRTLQCRTCHRIAHEALGFGGEGSGCTFCEPPEVVSRKPFSCPSGTLSGLGVGVGLVTLSPVTANSADAFARRMAPDALYGELERRRLVLEGSKRTEDVAAVREMLDEIRAWERE